MGVYYNMDCEKESNILCLNSSLRKALRILLNSKYLDLTIDPATEHFGLRFYTLFNRLDAVGGVIPELKNGDLISLQANIITPVGYNPLFDNTDRNTILPTCDLRSIAFVVQENGVDDLLRELKCKYQDEEIYNSPCSCNEDLLAALLSCRCDAFSSVSIYEIGVDAIDRSNNPIRGKVVAYDSQLIWVQATTNGIPPTFYIVPLNSISFVCKQ